MQNYDYKHAFLWILNFYIFLPSFHSCSLHICTAWALSSLMTSSISISVGQNRELCGENQRRMNYRDMNEGWSPLLLIMNVLK